MTEILPIRRKTLYNQSINQPNPEFIAPAMIRRPTFQKGSAIIGNFDKLMEKQDDLISKSLVSTANGVVPMKDLNLNDESLHLHESSAVPSVEKVEGKEETSAGLVYQLSTQRVIVSSTSHGNGFRIAPSYTVAV